MTDNPNAATPNLPPAAPPPQRVASNGFGLASMILGIVTMAIFAIPFLNFVGIATGIVGIVLGIIGLVIKFKPRKAAIAGVIMSGLGLILSVLLVTVYTAAFNSAVQTTTDATLPSSSAEPDVESDSPAQDQPDGTRKNPFPIGTTVENDEWAVTINSVTFGADDAVAAANQFNDEPEAGHEYMLINVTMTYKSDDPDGGTPAFVSLEYVTPDGATVDSLKSFAVAPDALDSMSTLYEGASATGNEVIQVPSENASAGVIVVRPGMFADKSFFAAK